MSGPCGRALLFLLLPVVLAAEHRDLAVLVTGIRPEGGLIRLSLFRSPDGYPEASQKAGRTLSIPAEGPTLAVRFDTLPAGDWALAVLHDANGNGKLDRNPFGIPREGIGASNGAHRRLGAPRFADARFRHPGGGDTLSIGLKYW